MIISDSIDEVPSPGTSGSTLPWETSTPATLGSDATQRLIAALPEDTFQLIVREAYLFRAGQIIFDAMNEAKARHEQLSASRPPFLAFRRARTKEAFTASLTSANQDFSLYQNAMKRNAEAMKRLRKLAELHIEDWLRQNDATYYAGLVSESLVADWHRCLSRLESELGDFVTAIGCARNSLVAAQPDAAGVRHASPISCAAIVCAGKVGEILANDVAATNVLADERDRHLHGTAFEATFPRLPTFDFASSLKEATQLPVSFLQQHFAKILKHCAELRAVGLPALLQQVQQAEAQHTAVKEGYLVGVWQALREFALKHYVTDDDLTEVAHATEQMFEEGKLA